MWQCWERRKKHIKNAIQNETMERNPIGVDMRERVCVCVHLLLRSCESFFQSKTFQITPGKSKWILHASRTYQVDCSVWKKGRTNSLELWFTMHFSFLLFFYPFGLAYLQYKTNKMHFETHKHRHTIRHQLTCSTVARYCCLFPPITKQQQQERQPLNA